MKLSERFESFTPSELCRAIKSRESMIVKTESEIRALRKLLKQKDRAIARAAGVMVQDGGTNGEDCR